MEVDPADVGAENARKAGNSQDVEESDSSEEEDGDVPADEHEFPERDADVAARTSLQDTRGTPRTTAALAPVGVSSRLNAEGRARVERFLSAAVSGAEAVSLVATASAVTEQTPDSAAVGAAVPNEEAAGERDLEAESDAGSGDGAGDDGAASARSHSAGHPAANDALKMRVRRELRAEQQHARNRRIIHTARAQLQARARRERKQTSDLFE